MIMNEELKPNNQSIDEMDNTVESTSYDKNTICLGAEYPAEDGAKVSATVEGTISVKDGEKFLVAETVDGQPVVKEEVVEESELTDEAIESELADFSNKTTGLKGYKA